MGGTGGEPAGAERPALPPLLRGPVTARQGLPRPHVLRHLHPRRRPALQRLAAPPRRPPQPRPGRRPPPPPPVLPPGRCPARLPRNPHRHHPPRHRAQAPRRHDPPARPGRPGQPDDGRPRRTPALQTPLPQGGSRPPRPRQPPHRGRTAPPRRDRLGALGQLHVLAAAPALLGEPGWPGRHGLRTRPRPRPPAPAGTPGPRHPGRHQRLRHRPLPPRPAERRAEARTPAALARRRPPRLGHQREAGQHPLHRHRPRPAHRPGHRPPAPDRPVDRTLPRLQARAGHAGGLRPGDEALRRTPVLLMWGGYPGECEGRHPVSIAADLGISDSVFFTGWRGHDDLPSGLQVADVMAAPAVREPFGMVYCEALSAGCPPIATSTGGPARIITGAGDNANGWLIAPDSSDDLAAALVHALTDKRERSRRAANGAVHAREN
ncbi:glycosyltransferase, partial [Kitasatospora sp. NPDC001574]